MNKKYFNDIVCLLLNCLIKGHAALFATLISRTAKDIDFLIESLPSEECSSALQVFKSLLLINWRQIGRRLGLGRSSIDICVTLSIRA